MTGQSAYRADIDGLRALAVIPVVLFHAGLAAMPGGFVGVDVFFVISGYLISRQIFADVEQGRFSVIAFYERRARRLLPAFFTVAALSAIAAYILLLPEPLERFGESLAWSTLSAGNVYFWLEADYFGPDAESNPLLHLWSLGVEEQFYLVFPWLMILLFRFGRKVLIAGLLAFTLASLLASELMVRSQPETAFYLLPFRAWELLLGGLLAIGGIPKIRSPLAASLVVWTGVAMIMFAVFTYSADWFPGFKALLPVAGAALILWAGETGNDASTGIGSQPLAYVGRISYSLYLVHWPLIVFGREAFPDAGDTAIGACAVALSFILAALIYHFIETPTRNRAGYWNGARIRNVSIAGIAGFVALGAAIDAAGGIPSRMPPEVMQALKYRYDKSDFRIGVCYMRMDQEWKALDQRTCLPGKKPLAVLWGDSHAGHHIAGLRPLIEEAGYTFGQINAAACRPVFGLVQPHRPNCKAFNESAFTWVKKNKPALVILSASWTGEKEELARLRRQIAGLTKLGIRIVVLGRGPRFSAPVPDIVALRLWRGEGQRIETARPVALVTGIDNAMARAVKPLAPYISVLQKSCPKQRCQLNSRDGTPFYWDATHQTDIGAIEAARLMRKDFLKAITIR